MNGAELASLMGAWAAGVPRLHAAACHGVTWLADVDIRSSRATIDAALEVCLGCRELLACSSWVDQLPADQRPVGMVAARLIDPTAYQVARSQRPAARLPTVVAS